MPHRRTERGRGGFVGTYETRVQFSTWKFRKMTSSYKRVNMVYTLLLGLISVCSIYKKINKLPTFFRLKVAWRLLVSAGDSWSGRATGSLFKDCLNEG